MNTPLALLGGVFYSADTLNDPVLQEANEEIEAALQRLRDRALTPLRLPAQKRKVVAALLDLDMWRSLDRQGVRGTAATRTVADLIASQIGTRG